MAVHAAEKVQWGWLEGTKMREKGEVKHSGAGELS